MIWKLKFTKLQQESGYPYVVNASILQLTALILLVKIIIVTCVQRFFQVQERLINDKNSLKWYWRFSCNLQFNKRGQLMMTSTLTLVVLSELWYVLWLSLQIVLASSFNRPRKQQAHTFGLGAMGLHDYLAQQLIEYGSPSLHWIHKHLLHAIELLDFLVESNNIARERGYFHNFWKIELHWRKLLIVQVVSLYHLIVLRTLWRYLYPITFGLYFVIKLKLSGLYHQNLTCWHKFLSATSTCSASIHPITRVLKNEKKIVKTYYPAAWDCLG